MKILVGHTGFVGSNLAAKYKFDACYNSQNIKDAFGTNPDLCIYSGVRAEKFLANNNADADMDLIKTAINNIKLINPSRLVLISTIDVFSNPVGVDEDSPVSTDGLHPYGYNRYYLETWCIENIKHCHIIRLPGLFGVNLKKNFIYDIINFFPSMLNKAKFDQFSSNEPIILEHYISQNNGFYKYQSNSNYSRSELINAFKRLNFSALNFTDSRSIFQFYNLNNLWNHIQTAINNNIMLLHLSVEPISARDLYFAVTQNDFTNHLNNSPMHYNFITKYSHLFGGENGYIFNRQNLINDVYSFVRSSAVN